MNYYDVSVDDEMVVDNEGTIWVARGEDTWTYITAGGLSWDGRARLPEEYIYHRLDDQARRVIRNGLRSTHHGA